MTYKEHSSVFGIEVNFLTGRYAAMQHNHMTQPEWPRVLRGCSPH